MSAGKIVLLVVYAVLALLAITQAGTMAGTVATWIIVGLLVAHTIEVLVYFKLCQQAGGSLVGNLVNVFLFGVLHAKEMKGAMNS
jgi:uncharacterized protein YhhL (DUF1145 family)